MIISPTNKHVEINGVATSFWDVGDGGTLVALHGIPTSSALFTPLLPFLGEYRVIAPDLLGQGETEIPRHGPLGHAAYAAHLATFLDMVAPSQFHLLVHDFGGVLGLEWAADHPERVHTLTILSTTICWSFRVGALLYAVNFLLGRALLRWGMQSTLKRARVLEPALIELWAKPWTRRRLVRGMNHFAPVHLRRLRLKLTNLHAPTLIIWGEQDNIFPLTDAKRILNRLPQAQFVTIPQCGHWAPLDAPEEVAHAMLRFLRSAVERDGIPRQ